MSPLHYRIQIANSPTVCMEWSDKIVRANTSAITIDFFKMNFYITVRIVFADSPHNAAYISQKIAHMLVFDRVYRIFLQSSTYDETNKRVPKWARSSYIELHLSDWSNKLVKLAQKKVRDALNWNSNETRGPGCSQKKVHLRAYATNT